MIRQKESGQVGQIPFRSLNETRILVSFRLSERDGTISHCQILEKSRQKDSGQVGEVRKSLPPMLGGTVIFRIPTPFLRSGRSLL